MSSGCTDVNELDKTGGTKGENKRVSGTVDCLPRFSEAESEQDFGRQSQNEPFGQFGKEKKEEVSVNRLPQEEDDSVLPQGPGEPSSKMDPLGVI